MSDEELLYVAADRQDLVEEAAGALNSELAKRGLREANATKFKNSVDRIAAWETIGKVGLSFQGSGKQFVGASNYSEDSQTGFEEFDSILWLFFAFIPLLPLSTLRIKRRTQRRSIFWSFWNKDFTAIELKGINFGQVVLTYIGAAIVAYAEIHLLLFAFDALFLHALIQR